MSILSWTAVPDKNHEEKLIKYDTQKTGGEEARKYWNSGKPLHMRNLADKFTFGLATALIAPTID